MTDEIQTFETEFDGMSMGFEGGAPAPVFENPRDSVTLPPLTSNMPAMSDARAAVDSPAVGAAAAAAADTSSAAPGTIEFVNSRGRQNADMQDVNAISIQALPDIDTPEMYPPGYSPPSLAEAAREAGIRDADAVAAKCLNRAQADKDMGLYDSYEIDVQDAAVILMYTADRGGDLHNCSPYLVINQALDSRDPQLLFACRHLIWMLLTAVRKLRRVYGKSLFRGITRDLPYTKGQTICWHRFTSTTLDLGVTKNFMAMASGSSPNADVHGTVFILSSQDCWGYDIRPFSFFPSEEELLLEPESLFTVESMSTVGSLTMCHLQSVKHPLLLENRIPCGNMGRESMNLICPVTLNVPEPKVSVVDGSVGFNSVHVVWNDVISTLPDEVRANAFYEVLVKDETKSDQQKTIQRTNETEARFSVLLPQRRYQVKCRVNYGNVTNWGHCSFTTLPIPIVNLSVDQNSVGFNSFVVSWNDVVDRSIVTQQEQQYTVQVSAYGGSFNNYSVDAGTPIKIDNLDEGRSYRVRVKLVLIDGDTGERVDGDYSDILQVKTFSVPLPTFAVRDLSYNSMTICWAPPERQQNLPHGCPPGEYEVEWSERGSLVPLYKGPALVMPLLDLIPNKPYSFRARFLLPDRSSDWTKLFVVNTTSIPVPVVKYDRIGDISRISGSITNVQAIQEAFSPADLGRIRYEFHLTDKTDDSEKTFYSQDTHFSKALSSTHKYSIMCRIVIGKDCGEWSQMRTCTMPESFAYHAVKSVCSLLSSFLWELGTCLTLFALLICFGVYLDDGSTTPLLVLTFIMLVLFGSIIMVPISVLKWNTKLPPILGLFLLPLTETDTPSRKTGAKVYTGLLFIQYISIIATLVLLIARLFGADSVNLFFISVPVSFAFTVIPAVILPTLFLLNLKGRYELLLIYSILFPFWGPLMMATATLDGIIIISPGVMFLPMYLAFACVAALAALSCCVLMNNSDASKPMLGFAFSFGVVVALPTFLIMPILLSTFFEPIFDITVTYTAAFSPVYIDILIACGISIVAHFVDELNNENVAWVLRKACKAASICKFAADTCEK